MKEVFVTSLLVVALVVQVLLLTILSQRFSLLVVVAVEIATAVTIWLLFRRVYIALFE